MLPLSPVVGGCDIRMGVVKMLGSKGRSKRSFDRILSGYKYKDFVAKLSNYPILKQIGWWHMDMDNTILTYVPIYEDMELPAGTAAPVSIIEHFIREASDHLILSRCPCRSGNDCQDYDPYFGCTFLGPAVRNVDPEVGRLVSMEEALDHLHEATEAGLISCLIKGRPSSRPARVSLSFRRRFRVGAHQVPSAIFSSKWR